MFTCFYTPPLTYLLTCDDVEEVSTEVFGPLSGQTSDMFVNSNFGSSGVRRRTGGGRSRPGPLCSVEFHIGSEPRSPIETSLEDPTVSSRSDGMCLRAPTGP